MITLVKKVKEKNKKVFLTITLFFTDRFYGIYIM